MNNKKKGNDFEKRVCKLLAERAYWVHFISPDITGKQPFDIIAVKDGIAYAIDCKTSVRKTFGLDRVEDNQNFAFRKWLKCGNEMPCFFVEYKDDIKIVRYDELLEKGRVNLDECMCLE